VRSAYERSWWMRRQKNGSEKQRNEDLWLSQTS
jgi:hypothetical protein